MTTYFVRTRHHYGTYDDLFKLAELSGYPVIYLDEIEQHDALGNVFIISPVNGEWLHWERGRYRGKLILWQLEWLQVDGNPPPLCVDETWCSDAWEARRIGARYIPMGSHEALPAFRPEQPLAPVYDVAQISYQVYRRQEMSNKMHDLGLRLAPVENLWGVDRSQVLWHSRVMVHVHQHDNVRTVAPLRWCIAAAHRLPLITEAVNDAGIFNYNVMHIDTQWLPGFVYAILNMQGAESILKTYAQLLHQKLCVDMPFRVSVERAL